MAASPSPEPYTARNRKVVAVDLIMFVLVIAVVGLIGVGDHHQNPDAALLGDIIQVLAALVLLVYVLRVVGAGLPNVLP